MYIFSTGGLNHMKRRFFLFTAPMIVVLVGIGFLFIPARPCYACSAQTPPPLCNANMSATTVQHTDTQTAWWNVLAPRPDRTVNVYLGLNHNQGGSPATYQYQLDTGGDWDPSLAGGLTPITGTGTLGPAGSASANNTVKMTIPYSATQTGDLTITATVTSPDCPFQSPVTTTVRLNDSGPTVWAVTPRTCPEAGDERELTFGVHNPNEDAQTYNVTARAYNPLNGSASEQFNLNGAGSDVTLPPLTVDSDDTEEVKVSCETFGYCVTGGENRVEVQVDPMTGTAEAESDAFEAIAWSNVTIRDPETDCAEPEDWWFIMPPFLLGSLIGIPALLTLLGGGTAYAMRQKPYTPPSQPGFRSGGGRTPPPPKGPPTPGNPVTHGQTEPPNKRRPGDRS